MEYFTDVFSKRTRIVLFNERSVILDIIPFMDVLLVSYSLIDFFFYSSQTLVQIACTFDCGKFVI